MRLGRGHGKNPIFLGSVVHYTTTLLFLGHMVVVDSNAYHWVENDGIGRGNCGEAVNFGLLRGYKEWKAKTIEEICSCRDVHNRFHAHEQEKMEEYFKSTKDSNCYNSEVQDSNSSAPLATVGETLHNRVTNVESNQILAKTTVKVLTNSSGFGCTYCGKVFNVKSNLHRHEKLHEDNLSVECNICLKTFKNQNVLYQHVRRVHGSSKNSSEFGCTHCGKVFNVKANLHRHEKLHEESSMPKCAICCKTLKNQTVLYQHVRRVHGSNCCPSCHYRCHKVQDLKTHDHCIQCREEDCSFVSQSRRDLELHQQNHHGRVPCEHCPKTFTRRQKYLLHLAQHNN